MKNFNRTLMVSLLLALTLNACGSKIENSNRPITVKLLQKEQLNTYTIPGFLVRYVMLVSEETRKIRPAFKGVSSLTVSFSDKKIESSKTFSRINSSLNKNNYSTLLEVIDSKSCITVKVLEVEGIIKEMVFLIDDDQSLVCLSMKGKMNADQLFEFVTNFAGGNRFAKV